MRNSPQDFLCKIPASLWAPDTSAVVLPAISATNPSELDGASVPIALSTTPTFSAGAAAHSERLPSKHLAIPHSTPLVLPPQSSGSSLDTILPSSSSSVRPAQSGSSASSALSLALHPSFEEPKPLNQLKIGIQKFGFKTLTPAEKEAKRWAEHNAAIARRDDAEHERQERIRLAEQVALQKLAAKREAQQQRTAKSRALRKEREILEGKRDPSTGKPIVRCRSR